MSTRVVTDTATIVVFDPARLKHRVADSCDWWSVPDEELAEINAGNVLFLATGADGVFELDLTEDEPDPQGRVVEAVIKNDSGRLFIGAGECVSGGDLQPEAKYGNEFVTFPPGPYRVRAWMEASRICLHVAKASEFVPNQFTDSPSLA